jgi:hypothetical protein
LFTYVASKNCKLALLNKSHFKELNREDEFNQVLNEIVAVQLFTGSKYDYYVPSKAKPRKRIKAVENSSKAVPLIKLKSDHSFLKPKDETDELCKKPTRAVRRKPSRRLSYLIPDAKNPMRRKSSNRVLSNLSSTSSKFKRNFNLFKKVSKKKFIIR